MNPGQFRHITRITLSTETQDSNYGGFQNSSSVTHQRYAKIKWLPGNEKEEADTITLNKNIEFTYRYESLINLIERVDYITYKNDKFLIYNLEYKGHGNQQLICIKARTFTD
jgi:head-tail adaptor